MIFHNAQEVQAMVDTYHQLGMSILTVISDDPFNTMVYMIDNYSLDLSQPYEIVHAFQSDNEIICWIRLGKKEIIASISIDIIRDIKLKKLLNGLG